MSGESAAPLTSVLLLTSGYKAIVDSIPDAAWLKDKWGRYAQVNERFLSIHGLSLDAVIGKKDREVFPGDLADIYGRNDEEAISAGARTESAEPVRSKDGRKAVVETTRTPLYDEAREFLGLAGVAGAARIEDEGVQSANSGAVRAEEALKQAEERYRNIYENAVEGIFRTTADGRLIDANPAFARILGYDDPKELVLSIVDVGKQVFGSERRRAEYMALMETAGEVRDFETQVRCKDGSMQWVSVNARSAGDGSGPPIYEGAIESITERKKLEAQLRHAQRMESIGTLAGGVAHDFNNVLTTIMGYCSLIMMKAGDKHPYAGYVNQIMEAANRASALTQSLLAFSRKQAMEIKPVDINETIRGVEKLLRRIIGEDIELQTQLCKERLIVLVGDGHISQLLMNLATNARDAMPDGGVLTIRTEAVHLGNDLVGAYEDKEGTYAALEISDTGSGMDEKTKDQIFDPFFTTKEVGKGTGLGLSIVYGIVNQDKGYVTVTSELGRGSIFTVYLPIAEALTDEEVPLERARLQGGNEKILVAEDNAQVREIVTTTLRDFGYTVVEASDGAEAIEKFNEDKAAIDLLLLDVIMPRKNGREAYVAIKKVRPDVRAIFMSGYTGDILTKKGISREGIPMISKPIVIEKLLRVIREVLDSKPAQLSLFP